MPSAEERQVLALQRIAQSNRELVNVISTLNENLVTAFKYIKDAIEKEDARHENDPNQIALDLLRAEAEQREKRKDHEESLRPGPGIGIELGSPVHSKSFGIHGTVTELHSDRAKVVFSSGSPPVWIPKSDLTVQLPTTTFDEADPIQDKVTKAEYERSAKLKGIDIDANKVEHMSEFNNPEHRPIKFQPPGDGVE